MAWTPAAPALTTLAAAQPRGGHRDGERAVGEQVVHRSGLGLGAFDREQRAPARAQALRIRSAVVGPGIVASAIV